MTVLPRAALRVGTRGLSTPAALWALALLACGSGVGCDSCQRDRPYVPFRVDPTGMPSASSSASAPEAASALPSASAAAPLEARKLEPPLGRFDIGPRSVELPKEMLAERVLERPTGDQLDALVWAIPAKPDAEWNGPMGELWWFPAGGDPKKLFALPGWMPSGPGCTHASRLAYVGKETAVIDVTARCERSLPQRTPIRALALLSLGKTPAFILGLRVAEPAADEVLTVTPMASDRDGDGREDPAVQLDLDVASTKAHATAALGWLDRAAGASTDESHFTAALEPTLKGWEAALGKKAKLATVLSEVGALRRLLSSTCQQSATPRVFDWRGDPLRCPGMTQVAVRLARLEVKASLGLGDVLEAAHALAYSSSWQGGIPTVEREDLRKRIEKSLSKVTVGLPAAASIRPAVSADPVRYSPLTFEGATSSLLVQVDRGGLVRLALDGSSSPVDPDAGVSGWPLSVTGPDGRRWVNVVPACDRSELSLAMKAVDGQFLPLSPTRLLAPRPGVCRNPTNWPVSTGPLRWDGDGPMAIINGVCWANSGTHACPNPDKMGPVIPGSPRSPDGRRLVVVTSLGPVVVGGSKPELWSGSSIDGKRLSDCVVANDAMALACIVDGIAMLVGRPAAPSSN